MAYIKVDHKKLDSAAAEIDTYVSKHKNNMKNIDSFICGLNSHWKGKDYQQVKDKWEEMNSVDFTSGKMIKALDNYADFLRYASKKYKDAQSKAINRANGLPRY